MTFKDFFLRLVFLTPETYQLESVNIATLTYQRACCLSGATYPKLRLATSLVSSVQEHTSKKTNFQDCCGVFLGIFDFHGTKELIFHGELDNYHTGLFASLTLIFSESRENDKRNCNGRL